MNAIDVATLAVVISYGLLVLCTAGVLVAAVLPAGCRCNYRCWCGWCGCTGTLDCGH